MASPPCGHDAYYIDGRVARCLICQSASADAMGWHVISGEDLLASLRRCTAGEDADVVMAELWANADHD